MARDGFTVKQIAFLLGIQPNSVTASIDPALRKMARLYLANPVKFWEMWLPFLRELQGDIEERARHIRQEAQHGRDEVHGRTPGARISTERP